jgi:hypothetical protein
MLEKAFLNTNFYFVYNIYIYEKCMGSLGLYAIHFRILIIVRLCFSNVLGRFFRLKIASLLGFCRENQSAQLHFTAGSCVSEWVGCKKPARSDRLLSQSDCFILTDKK